MYLALFVINYRCVKFSLRQLISTLRSLYLTEKFTLERVVEYYMGSCVHETYTLTCNLLSYFLHRACMLLSGIYHKISCL